MRTPHFLTTVPLTATEIESLIDQASRFLTPTGLAAIPPSTFTQASGNESRIVLAFYESSTRTRLSFETAAHRIGARTVIFDPSTSSEGKGETFLDTVQTIDAMGFDVLVLRHAQNGIGETISASTSMSIVNAGDGTNCHPTQGMLDASALRERLGTLGGQKICIVGDVRHSRVARSQVDVLQKLGAEFAICAPESLLPDDERFASMPRFDSLDGACEWATVISLLRIQRERITADVVPSMDVYRARFAMTSDRLRKAPNVTIIHPGPVNYGVEIDEDVAAAPQSLIRRQVTHGVAMRMTILNSILQQRNEL
ncbi:aspartate carbamoyltransferase catalytic subunit [soil metagenome]